jgi:hypothetical protein
MSTDKNKRDISRCLGILHENEQHDLDNKLY